jgi:aminoglycoside 6'-N-acetyltransferase I
MPTTTRPASAADFPAWAAMRQSLWPDTAESHLRELAEFLPNPDFAAFIAELDGRQIGFAEVSIRPFANGCDTRPVPFLEGIWVDPGYRSRGAGAALLSAVEDWARARGFQELGSDTEIANVPSIASHLAWGFEETERVVYFRKSI